MVEIWMPYGKTETCLAISAENLLGTIEPQPRPVVTDPESELKFALENPLGSPRLREIVKSGSRIAIAVDITTSAALNQLMLSKILKELKDGAISESNITIIFSNWSQRPPDKPLTPLGEDALSGLLSITHDPDSAELMEVGVTSYKTRVMLSRAFAEADFKVLIGEAGFDPYAGYSGGRIGVLTLGGSKTIQHNQSLITDPHCRVGNLEKNPVHLDMVEAATLAKVDFILNIVTDSAGGIVKAFAGGLEPVFLESVKFLNETFGVIVDKKADIVAVSPGGHPYDDDFYHALRSLDRALDIVRDGGVVVLVAECAQGHGSSGLYKWMSQLRSFEDAREAVKKNFTPEFHAAYLLLRAQQKARIVALTAMPEHMTTGIFKLRGAKCTDDALETAFRLAGRKVKIWVIPRGHTTLPIFRATEQPRTIPE